MGKLSLEEWVGGKQVKREHNGDQIQWAMREVGTGTEAQQRATS